MEVRIYDRTLSVKEKYEEMQLIKRIDNIEMNKDMEFGGFILIDGQSYRHCTYNPKKNLLCVEPVMFNEQPEEIEYSEEFKCPYCGNVNEDAWELQEDQGETFCDACGSDLEYERIINIEYNIIPKKCATVTKV